MLYRAIKLAFLMLERKNFVYVSTKITVASISSYTLDKSKHWRSDISIQNIEISLTKYRYFEISIPYQSSLKGEDQSKCNKGSAIWSFKENH